MNNLGEKLDQISSAPYYCVKTLIPLGIGLFYATYNALTSGFLAFSLFSKVLITSCAFVALTILLFWLGTAYSNRLTIHQRGMARHTGGYARHIEDGRIGKFVWKNYPDKGALLTRRVHTCSIIDKHTGKCLARLSSTKYSHLGDKMTKLEHKLGI